MTTIKILGQEPIENVKKSIEFSLVLTNQLITTESKKSPSSYKHIILLQKDYRESGKDLMYAYDDDFNHKFNGAIYLGHFNDGII